MGNDVSTATPTRGKSKKHTAVAASANGGTALNNKKEEQRADKDSTSSPSTKNQHQQTKQQEQEKQQQSPPPKPNTKEEKDDTQKQPRTEMEESATTFEGEKKKSRSRDKPDPVMITDALTDVRTKYHINPREIGHGHYGVVRKCMDRETREWFAIKSIRKSKVGKVDVLKREIDILKEVDHPHIIKLVEVHEDVKYLHLVTELCTGGELFDRIIAKTQSSEGHFSEHDAATIVRCILDAIAYCHDVKQIVHRDLKPENFLFKTEKEDAEIKIIDFGLSRHDTLNFGVMKTKVGTPYYVAPEVLKREYTKSCDIWSIGVITYILLCGYPPFYGDSDNQIFESVKTGRFDFPSPDWDSISDDAKDFICCMLRKEPSKRLRAAEALKHKWIKDQSDEEDTISRERSKVQHSSNRSVTFKKFMGMQKLKKAALGYIATHLTNSEVGVLGDIFHKIDESHTGVISLQDLDNALAHGNFPPELLLDLRQLREDLSLSGEETLLWKDFLAAMMDKSVALREDKIRMAFEHFKRNDSNDLLVSDLFEIFGEAQAREIFGDADIDGDGRISFEDFRSLMADSFAEDS